MANSTTDLVFRLSSITGLGMRDINGNDAEPQGRPGAISIVTDDFGVRILKYIRNVNGSAITMGELHSYASDTQNTKTTTVSNITSGTTTSAVTTGLTASRHQGGLCYVLDNADSAGDAPETEISPIAGNTTTAITLDADYPLTVALAANDDLELISTWQIEDSADGDEAWTVTGVVLGNQGLTNLYYGWIQVEGPVRADVTATTTIAEGDPVVAGANLVNLFGSDGHELWIGTALAAATNDIVSDSILVHLQLFSTELSGGTP